MSTVSSTGGTTAGPARSTSPAATAAGAHPVNYVWAATRILLGFTFLWPFLDKAFGLGHETPSAKSWVNGGSPTAGFLKGSKGPFSGLFHSMAGSAVWDWLFMLGLLGIGVALLLGIGMRIATISGVVLLVLMFAASLPPANNPVIDDHIVYAVVLIGLAAVHAGRYVGFGTWWENLELVRHNPWLA
jgi:thiosulfate dehydrogenase [quinone] large subunit